MAWKCPFLTVVVSFIALQISEASECAGDRDEIRVAKQALSHDMLPAADIAVKLVQKKSAINELRDSKRIVHGLHMAEAEAKQHERQNASIASNVSEVAASIKKHDEETPIVQFLPRYAKCWDMGWDEQSRDAICMGDLQCARKDFGGRDFGDCDGEHCCSKDDVIVKTFRKWMGSTSAFVLMLLAIICICDPNIRNLFCGPKKK